MSASASIALVGCGRWGKHILRDLVALGCEVTVVARSEASVARAREGKAATIVDSVDRLTAPDGVVVAVPTGLHAAVLGQVLNLGVPVFVEKPITDDPSTARQFEKRKDLFVMDKWRYHPGVELLREIVEDARYGALRGIQTIRHSLYNPHLDSDAVWILLPHDLSIILELTGGIPEPLAALGEVEGIEASLTGLLDDGIAVDVSSRSNVYRRELRVRFDSAVVTLTDGYSEVLDVRVTSQGREPESISIPIGLQMPLEAELAAFIDHLRGGPPPRSSAAEAVLIVERVQQLRDLAGI
jgi:predicted dehydrogenase